MGRIEKIKRQLIEEANKRILREFVDFESPKLLSQLTQKGRGPKSHYAQVSKDKEGNPVPNGQGMNNWQSRNAYDLMCPVGTEVLSPVNGKITKARQSNSKNPQVYGWNIVISTDDGDQIFMTHLDYKKDKAEEGDIVKKGDLLGYIGDPKSDEVPKHFPPHLHVSTKNESHDIYNYLEPDLSIKFTEEEKQSILDKIFQPFREKMNGKEFCDKLIELEKTNPKYLPLMPKDIYSDDIMKHLSWCRRSEEVGDIKLPPKPISTLKLDTPKKLQFSDRDKYAHNLYKELPNLSKSELRKKIRQLKKDGREDLISVVKKEIKEPGFLESQMNSVMAQMFGRIK